MLDFLEPRVEVDRRSDGSLLLRSPVALAAHERVLGAFLARWAARAPDRLFLAERQGADWRKLTYGEASSASASVAQALLDRGLDATTPVMALSGNGIDFAILMLACHRAGIPFVPVSPAYSLMSRDYAKVVHIFDLVRPKAIYVASAAPFSGALAALRLDGVDLIAGAPAAGATLFADLLGTRVTSLPAVEAGVGPDTIAKILFTSGSTGLPKGVINTHGMLAANQQQAFQCWPFLKDHPPVLLDWLPWNHTFGGSYNFNMVMRHGGELWIDDGRPAPGLIDRTVENLRMVSPSIMFNVPAGYGALIPYLERDDGLAKAFFARLQMIFYAAAALPQDLWTRLEALSLRHLGRKVAMTSAWGSTETSPLSTIVHFPLDRAGVIGLPIPGVTIKMTPVGGKMELRVKGPNVTPGYFGRPDLTKDAFDEEGFYRMGDAGRLADPADPAKGIVFDGRTAEDFKLFTGTWVSVGQLRVAALAAASPLLQDAVVCGHDRGFVGLLAWPNMAACRALAGLPSDAAPEAVLAAPAVREHIRAGLARHNAANPGTSTVIARVLLMAEPPSIDGNEITDKGYVNQRATLERRAGLVERLFADPPPDDVIPTG